MAGLTDIMGVLQSGVAVMASLQETQAKLVPTNSSGQLGADALVLSGFVRVLGVSVIAGTTAKLHDAAALADAATTNAVYVVPGTTGFYPTNMVFIKGLVLKSTATQVALFYSRI